MSTIAPPNVQRLSLGTAGVLMTPEQFDAITDWDEDYSYELIHGVLVVTQFAGPSERFPNDTLARQLGIYQVQHPNGHSVLNTVYEHYLTVGENRRRADRVIWTKIGSRSPDLRSTFPTIVIEFVSAGKAAWRRDYLEKRDEYLSAGALEYWVFDRFARSMTVFTMRDGSVAEKIVKEGETYLTELLPGFEVRPSELFAAADQWPAKE